MLKTQRVTLVGVNPALVAKLRLVLPSTYQLRNFTGTLEFGISAFHVIETEFVGWQTRLLQLIKAGEKLVVVFANPDPGWEKAVMAVGGVVLRPSDGDDIIRSALLRSKFIA